MEVQQPLPGLEQAIKAGGVCYRLPGKSKTDVLAGLAQRVRLPRGADRRVLLELLEARESLGSTAVGEGVAFPHLRQPGNLQVPSPRITVCFLANPVEFGALDGRPVHTLLAVLGPSVRSHLHLLSLLSYALRHEQFRGPIFSRAAPADILAGARGIDETLRARAET